MDVLEIIAILEQKLDELLNNKRSLEETKRHLEETLAQRDETIRELNERVEHLQNERAAIGNRVEGLLSKIAAVTGESSEGEFHQHHENVMSEG